MSLTWLSYVCHIRFAAAGEIRQGNKVVRPYISTSNGSEVGTSLSTLQTLKIKSQIWTKNSLENGGARRHVVCVAIVRRKQLLTPMFFCRGRSGISFWNKGRSGPSPRGRGAPSRKCHRRPFVGASQARSWSPWLVLGAILWVSVAKNRQGLFKIDF